MPLPPGPNDAFTLFVYGTLRRGGCRHGLLAGQPFLGEARTRPAYALFDLGDYPGLVPCASGGQSVRGELYRVDVALLPALDEEEGSPELFRLGPVELEGAGGPAHAYFYQRETAGWPRCRSGAWGGGVP